MPSVTYVFKTGRKEDLLKNTVRANDFFYGAKEFKKLGFDVNVIEFKKDYEKKSKFLTFFDRVLIKISGFPFSTSKLLTFKNFKIFFNSNVIFLVNESISISFIPFAFFLKFLKKTKINIFLMGITNLNKKKSKPSGIQKAITSLLFKLSNNVYFLGNGEQVFANSHYPKYAKKFKLVPFSVDYNFWSEPNNSKIHKKNGILFVGNDGQRDFDLLLKIAKNIKDLDFTFVTQKISVNKTLPSNVNLIRGSLHDKKLTDNELSELYCKSRIVILPLKESLQPSGQSVTLQSMASSTPVMISKTQGFWDFKNFQDKNNILLIEPNNLETWVKEIRVNYQNEDLLSKIATNAARLIFTKYNTKNLFDLLMSDNFKNRI